MVAFLVPPMIGSALSLRDVIYDLGLSSNLKLCLDAGDSESYSSGQVWLDRSGGGFDFNRGSGSGSDGADPTFNGTAGRLSANEYFSTDGGDYFSYDSSIETWMQAIGKSGGIASFLAVVYVPGGSDSIILSTRGAALNTRGFSFRYANTFTRFILTYISSTDSSVIFGDVSSPDVSASVPGLFMVGISYTLTGSATGRIHVNGTNASGSLVSTTPTSNNPTNNMKLLANGDAAAISPSGTKLYALAVWHGTALSAADFTALWNATRGRYGL